MRARCVGSASRFLLEIVVLLLGLAFVAPNLSGQQPPIADEPLPELAQAEQPRTLPPIEVVPPAELPPVEVIPDEGAGEYDRPFSFPSISEQQFGGSPLDIGGLNSANRLGRSLFDQPNLGTIVDQGLIREKSATDMFRALEQEVGVLMQATGRGQASPFLRGVTGQQVLILVDGIRVNNTTFRAGPNQYFNTIDPGQVERIEVIRGAGSVPWGGDAIGGVINIVTRGADPTIGDYVGGGFRQVFSSADNGSYSRANVEGWVGASGVFGGASYMRLNELDVGGTRGRQPFTDYDQYAGDVKYHWLVNADQMITVSLSHFEQQDLPRSDRFAPFVFNRPGNTPRPTFVDPQQRDLAYVRWQGLAYNENPLFDVFSVTGSYTRTKEGLEELRSPTQLDIGEFTDDMAGFTLTLSKDWYEFGTFTYGGDYYYEDVDAAKQRFNPANPAAPPTLRVPQFPDDGIADRAGVFASWDVPLTERLNLVTGARYENANIQGTPTYSIGGGAQDIFFERTYQEWIGSVGLMYDLTCDMKLVGGVYEGYRAPTLDDLAASTTFLQNAQQDPILASLAVEPEHSYTYEVGIKLDREQFRLQAYQWWMTIDDYITRDVDNVGNVFLGNSEAYLYGTELAGEYLLPRGWALYGNFAYTFGDDTGNNVPFTRIPPAQGIAGLRWRDECRASYFDVYTWLVYRQDRYTPGNFTDSRFWVNGSPVTPGYGTLNLRCGTALGECDQHRVSLVLENVTNQYYRVLGSGVDGTGFNAILGYEWLR